MSTLSVGDLQGLAVNSNVVTVPTGHTLNAVDGLQIGGVGVGEWNTWTPTVPNASWGAIVNGTITGLYAQVNDVIHYHIDYTFGSSDSVNNGWGLTPPVDVSTTVSAHGGCYLNDTSTGNAYLGVCSVSETDRIRPVFGDYGAFGVLTSTFPITWATGDRIRMWGTVRVA